MTIDIPRVLFIDSYDSFTFNLAALCRQAIPNCSIYIIKNDDFTCQDILPYLDYFSALLIGPGPGSPDNSPDIGVIKDLWKIQDRVMIPIFGVCLGLQSLGIEFGAKIQRLNVVKHGQVSRIYHNGMDIFKNVGDVYAVRYHSLHIDLDHDGNIEELAWTHDEENGKVIMAIKHKSKPFWAVQYHPESVCTHGGGIEVLKNFWDLTQAWSKYNARQIRHWDASVKKYLGEPWPLHNMISPRSLPLNVQKSVQTTVVQLPNLSVTTISELLGASETSTKFALLESAANPGRFSILASLMPSTLHVTHFVQDKHIILSQNGVDSVTELGSQDVWSWLASFMRKKGNQKGDSNIPFWGGFIGYLSYEASVPTLRVPLQRDPDHNAKSHPDVNLAFVERSLVMDTSTGNIFIQSLIEDDHMWMSETRQKLIKAAEDDVSLPDMSSTMTSPLPNISIPDKNRYIERILQAKEYLYAGDSYELCLTAQTKVSYGPLAPGKTPLTSWERYKRLRKSNPAPYSAYMRLHPSTILSSSPERFLSYSRPPGTICQLRPIKGTVRKGPGITRSAAEAALSGSVKEVAENLMIVDLIRHDLHAVLGHDVRVQQFCKVEEYETVWQLVSVIEGTRGPQNTETELGWEVLRSSLPPGSMTGAPKKRSVEILQTLEDQERSIYSGVFGYWCIGGGGDWSVAIRTCFNLNKNAKTFGTTVDNQDTTSEEWVIGAGGAITALSDPEAEWEEMLVKLSSVLRSFGALPSKVNA